MFTSLPDTAPPRHMDSDPVNVPQRPFRVLCLGDSLTYGYFCSGTGTHPYSGNLYLMLGDEFPRLDINVMTDGVPGDTVVGGSFLKRLNGRYRSGTCDWTIVLGGTNDLKRGASAQEIFEALQKIWAVPLSTGLNVLALTVPESNPIIPDEVRRRDELNRLIMQHQAPGFYAFDLHNKIPYHSLDDPSRALYWEDGLHLTEDGYDWMGGFIADELIRIIRSTQGRISDVSMATKSSTVATCASTESAERNISDAAGTIPTSVSSSGSASRKTSVRSKASVSANDINTRKPGDSSSKVYAKSASPPPSMSAGIPARSSHESCSAASNGDTSSTGSASPTYSLTSTASPFLAQEHPQKSEGSPVYFGSSPTRPVVHGAGLGLHNSGSGGGSSRSHQRSHSHSHHGQGHSHSHSHGNNHGHGHGHGHGHPHSHSGGVAPVRRSRRLAKRSRDMVMAEDDALPDARRADSGYVMISRKDLS